MFSKVILHIANLPGKSCALRVREHSHKQQAFLVERLFCAHMLNLMLPV